MADVENDAGADSVCAAKGLLQILKAAPIRAAGDSVPGVERCPPLGMFRSGVPNLLPA
jgi:hypothetical protein